MEKIFLSLTSIIVDTTELNSDSLLIVSLTIVNKVF